MDCLFCKIVSGEIPSTIVYQDEDCVAFRDINPQAPTHVLVIPRQHFASLSEAAQNPALLGHLLSVCAGIAKAEGIAEDGYRVVTNIGTNGAQSVKHLHFHVLGGRKMTEEMA